MQYSLRFLLVAFSFFAAAVLLLAPHMSFAAQITVIMSDSSFTPKNLMVYAGDTVTFVNSGAVPHTATADLGTFDSGTINPGQSYSVVLGNAGTFAYYCRLHGAPGGVGMAGSITVNGSVTNYTNPNSNYFSPGSTQVNTTPVSTNSAATANLQSQVGTLLQQVQALQQYYAGQPAATGGISSGASCPALSRPLGLGSEGADVTALQKFLAADPVIYPEGKATGYYGALTQAAVQRWQAQNKIVSSGTPRTTGYGRVGPATIVAIALVCSGSGGISGGASSDLGGFVKVTPISGAAPLRATFNVTVNVGNSCAAAIYNLDFGDGSNQPIPSVGGVCQPQSVAISHVYIYGGSYKVSLSSGSHEAHTFVSVSGSTKPSTTPDGSPQAAVKITDNSFVPQSLTVTPGTTVTWTSSSTMPRSVTMDSGLLDSGTMNPGQKYTIRFDQSGTYPYHDKFLGVAGSGMYGTITVGAPASGSGAPATATSANSAGSNSISSQASTATTYGPLTVTATGNKQATATFNTKGSCDAYSVDWGDDSNPIYRFPGNTSCTTGEKITIVHIFATSGTHTVTLGRGPAFLNEVTATVTVN